MGDKTLKGSNNQPNVSQVPKQKENPFLDNPVLVIIEIIIYLGAVLLSIPTIILLIMLLQEGDLRGEAAWPTFIAGSIFIPASVILTIIIKAKKDNR